jgi:hypothetical protein
MCKQRLIKRYFVAGVVVSAAALPGVAQATLIEVASGGGQSVARASAPARPLASARPLAPSTQSGFDWADAGIGAGGAILLVGAGVGGVVGIGHVRRRTDRRVLLG